MRSSVTKSVCLFLTVLTTYPVLHAQLPAVSMNSRNFLSPTMIQQITEAQRVDVQALNSTSLASQDQTLANGSTSEEVSVVDQSIGAGWISHLKGARGRLGLRVKAGRVLSSRYRLRRDAGGYLQERETLVEDRLLGNQVTVTPTMSFTLADAFTGAFDYAMTQWNSPDDQLKENRRHMRLGFMYHTSSLELGVAYQSASWGDVTRHTDLEAEMLASNTNGAIEGDMVTLHGRWMMMDLLALGFAAKQFLPSASARTPHWRHALLLQVPINEDLRLDAFIEKHARNAAIAVPDDQTISDIKQDEIGMTMEYRLNKDAIGIFSAIRGTGDQQMIANQEGKSLAWRKHSISLGGSLSL